MRVEEVRDGLYLLRGGGRTVHIGGVDVPQAGNSAVFVTSRGVVVVDTKVPGCGRAILEAVAGITDKPVTTVINTHAHFDHVGGNAELADGVEIVAHEETARLMREMRPVGGGPAQPDLFAASGGRGLPTRTFRDHLSLGGGAERIEIHHFGRAHTSGDAWVVFPALGVVHAGDAFPHKAVPLLDTNNGASGLEYPGTIARALAGLAGVRTLLSGHYPGLLTMDDLRTYAQFTRDLAAGVQAARRAGASLDDFVAGWRLPERLIEEGYVDVSHLRPLRADVEAIWNEAALTGS